MGHITVNIGYPFKTNVEGGVPIINSLGKIPYQFIPEMGGGFVEMKSDYPVESRKVNTLYGKVLVDFTGTAKTE